MPLPLPLRVARDTISPAKLQSQVYWSRFQAAGLRPRSMVLPQATLRLWQGGAERDPLLLIQGFGATALWQWHSQVGPLAQDRMLLVPDLPGFGGSRLHNGAYTLDAQVDVFVALLDRCGIDCADTVGISYGGFVAMRLAERYPDRVRRLVLVDSPALGYTAEDYDDLLRRFNISDIGELLLPEKPEQIRRLLRVAWHKPPWTPAWVLPDVHRTLFCDKVAEKREMLADLLTLLRRPGGPPEAALSHQAMVLWGEHDPIFPVHLGARLAARLGAALHTIPRTAHTPNMERPVIFNNLLSRFLRGSSG
jgi:pimeloyl-ACP methyl ester carboxylesterase